MSKLEDTAYNYGAKVKGRAMSDERLPITERQRSYRNLYDAAEHHKAKRLEAEAENDRLREALEEREKDVTLAVEALERIGKQSPQHHELVRQVWTDVTGAGDALLARIAELEAALGPFAALQVPKRVYSDSGKYSIFHDDIGRARAALAKEAGQ